MLKRFQRKRKKKSTLDKFIERRREFKKDAKQWISIGRGQVFAGQVDEALDTYNHVLKEDPSNEVARFLKQQALSIIEEAKNNPGGYVYRIKGDFADHDTVPFEAISGWWKVNDNGEIEGKFIPNPDHDPHLEKSYDPP